MKRAQKISIWIVLLLAFAGFQAIGSLYHIHVAVPFLHTPGECNHFIQEPQDGSGCTCKSVSYNHSSGFPLRTNLYDTCHRDEEPVPIVAFVNYIAQVIVLVALYRQLTVAPPKKRPKRHTK